MTNSKKISTIIGVVLLIVVLSVSAFSLFTNGVQCGRDVGGGVEYSIQVSPSFVVADNKLSLEMTVTIYKDRLDRMGLVDYDVESNEADRRIVVKVARQDASGRVRKMLTKTGKLEFYETYSASDIVGMLNQLSQRVAEADAIGTEVYTKKTLVEMIQPMSDRGPVVGYASAADTAAVNKIIYSEVAKTALPADLKLAWTVKPDKNFYEQTGKEIFGLIALRTVNGYPVLDWCCITEASTTFDQMFGTQISMRMNDEGARQWSRITGMNIGKSIAIVLDDQVYSYPSVTSQIDGGCSTITGDFTPEEADDFAQILNSGMLPCDVKVVGENEVEPESPIVIVVLLICVVLLVLWVVIARLYGNRVGIIALVSLLFQLFLSFCLCEKITIINIAGLEVTSILFAAALIYVFKRCRDAAQSSDNIPDGIARGYNSALPLVCGGLALVGALAFVVAMYTYGEIHSCAFTTLKGTICSLLLVVILRLLFPYTNPFKPGGNR